MRFQAWNGMCVYLMMMNKKEQNKAGKAHYSSCMIWDQKIRTKNEKKKMNKRTSERRKNYV